MAFSSCWVSLSSILLLDPFLSPTAGFTHPVTVVVARWTFFFFSSQFSFCCCHLLGKSKWDAWINWFRSNGKVLLWCRLILHSSCLSLSQPCVSSVGTVTGIAYHPADLPRCIPGAASGRQEGNGAWSLMFLPHLSLALRIQLCNASENAPCWGSQWCLRR